MKLFQVVSLVLGTLVVISACSGGGSGRPIGSQCPKNYNPVVMDVKEGKVALEADLPPGEYKYRGSEFYYVDAQTDFRVSIQDVELLGGTWEARRSCVRNAKIGMSDMEVKTLGLSDIRVETNKKITTFAAKALGFKVVNGALQGTSADLKEEEKPSSPKEVYDEGLAGERFIINVAGDRWEVRSTGVINGSQYQMVSRFDRVDLKPPKEEAEGEEKPAEEGAAEESTAEEGTAETPAQDGTSAQAAD